MNPLALRLRNYRSFPDLDLDLPAGCVAVLGENGAGKSSVVSAIDLALFGPESRSWAPYLTVGGEQTELMVELTFEHADAVYRVRRGYSARGAGKSTLDLELQLVHRTEAVYTWDALTLGSAKETQALLEQILGFTRRTLRASSLLLQGDGAAFSEADPRDRKRILADTLGLDRFDTYLARARTLRRVAETELAQIDGRLQGVSRDTLAAARADLEATLAGLTAEAANAELDLAAATLALEEAAQAWQSAQTRVAEHAAAIATQTAAAAAYVAHAQLTERALAAAGEAATLEEEIAALPAFDVAALEQREQELTLAVQAHRDRLRERDETIRLRELRENEKRNVEAQAARTTETAADLDKRIAHLESGDLDTCPTCEQTLGAEARATTVRSLRAQAQTTAEEAEAMFERATAIVLPEIPPEPAGGTSALQLETVRRDLAAARAASTTRARLLERVRGLSDTIMAAASPEYQAELERLEHARDAATAALAAIPPTGDTGTREIAAIQANRTVEHERGRLALVQREKAVTEERLAQHTAREEQAQADLASRETLLVDIDLLAHLERAYGPDGIPALIVENSAIPSIEVEANRILTELAGTTGGCRVELRTDRQKADGGIRDDVLDVIVLTDAGERAYETFSGGERTRLNLALRIALARLLATRRGAESRVLAIDEPEFLDGDGTEALADVLRGLEADSVFDRIYLVSHVPALRDAFDQVIEIVKTDGRSELVGRARAADLAVGAA